MQRPNKISEFFTVFVPEAILKIRQNSKVKFDEVLYKSLEEIKCEEERRKFKTPRYFNYNVFI